MLSARLTSIQQWLPGSRLLTADTQVHGVSTDTRGECAGRLFVALRGARHDGHDHLEQAMRAGAAAALVSRPVDSALPQLLCEDTLSALAALAAGWLQACPARRVALTGSNGKTTVKNLLAGILARIGRCHATAGNYNNEIGLPLTVLAMPRDSEFAVFEMGAGQPGDIAPLARLVGAEVALVTNVGPTHLERMGNEQTVADTKAAIYDALQGQGVAVINADDAFAGMFSTRAGTARILRFGIDSPGCEVRASGISLNDGTRFVLHLGEWQAPLQLPLAGRHNVSNALAAAAAAHALDVPGEDIVAGLQQARSAPGRYRELPQAGGWLLIDDSYNANPASLNAGVSTVSALPGEAWLVLGDMGELGPHAADLHAACGRHARTSGLSRLFALGSLSWHTVAAFGDGGQHFETLAALIDAVRTELRPGVNVLIKGSRSSAMERVVAALAAGGEG